VDYCKQSVRYKDYLNVLRANVVCVYGIDIHRYKLAFVSPPHCPDLRSNAPSPSDLDDATYIEQEEDDFEKKPPAKKLKSIEKKDKSLGAKMKKIKVVTKMFKFLQ